MFKPLPHQREKKKDKLNDRKVCPMFDSRGGRSGGERGKIKMSSVFLLSITSSSPPRSSGTLELGSSVQSLAWPPRSSVQSLARPPRSSVQSLARPPRSSVQSLARPPRSDPAGVQWEENVHDSNVGA